MLRNQVKISLQIYTNKISQFFLRNFTLFLLRVRPKNNSNDPIKANITLSSSSLQCFPALQKKQFILIQYTIYPLFTSINSKIARPPSNIKDLIATFGLIGRVKPNAGAKKQTNKVVVKHLLTRVTGSPVVLELNARSDMLFSPFLNEHKEYSNYCSKVCVDTPI